MSGRFFLPLNPSTATAERQRLLSGLAAPWSYVCGWEWSQLSRRQPADSPRSVVATSKDTYSLRYFKVDQDEAEDEE